MEFFSLFRHPASPSSPAIEVQATALVLATNSLSFRYHVRGDIQGLRIAKRGPDVRMDELWRHTCFEAFVSPSGAARYVEFNFAPSTAWAAYSFDSYRLGMKPLTPMKTPTIQILSSSDELSVTVGVQTKSLRFDSAVGLATVIEDSSGALSYWALAHPNAKPDFHDQKGWSGTFRRHIADVRT